MIQNEQPKTAVIPSDDIFKKCDYKPVAYCCVVCCRQADQGGIVSTGCPAVRGRGRGHGGGEEERRTTAGGHTGQKSAASETEQGQQTALQTHQAP